MYVGNQLVLIRPKQWLVAKKEGKQKGKRTQNANEIKDDREALRLPY